MKRPKCAVTWLPAALRRQPASGKPAVTPAVLLLAVPPEIPSRLRTEALQASFTAVFTVHADGSADVQTVRSTGNAELDRLALAAARQWRFAPATCGGEPVESYLRLEIEFQVG